MNVKKLLRDIDIVHKIFQKKFPIQHWDESFRENLKNNFTYHSNKIEGLTLSYGDTIEFLKTQLVKPGVKLKEIYDLQNHRSVLDHIFSSFEKMKLSEKLVQSLHAELMKDPEQWEDTPGSLGGPGQYKQENNFTFRPGLAVHEYLDFSKVEHAMSELLVWTDQKLSEAHITHEDHPIAVIAIFHYKFLNEIHPFANGNGRIARLLTTLLLLQKNYPPAMIKAEERQKYFHALIQTEKEKNYDYMITFTGEKILEAMEKRLKQKKA